jgi:hypothetical protein
LKRLIFAAIPIALIACRGIVGIQDLTVDDGGTTEHDAGTQEDAAPQQDSGRPPPDSAGGPETGNGCSANAHEACLACCMQQNMGVGMTLMQNGGQGCLCNSPGACKTQCAQYTCATPPNGNPPDQTCGACQTDAFLNGASAPCASVLSQCTDSACKALADCAKSCP